jgi:hypothetical protein
MMCLSFKTSVIREHIATPELASSALWITMTTSRLQNTLITILPTNPLQHNQPTLLHMTFSILPLPKRNEWVYVTAISVFAFKLPL